MYSKCITVIQRKFETCFPLVRISRKRLKVRPWIAAELKLSIKQSHRLYCNTLQNSCPRMMSKYKKYKAILRNCLKVVELNCHCQLFDETKQSFYHDVDEIFWPQPIRSLKLGHVTGQGSMSPTWVGRVSDPEKIIFIKSIKIWIILLYI